MRIAMWSGPRNLSTAMMYAFGNRADFAAWDEPFYAAYLAASGLDHPMRDVILASQSTDPGVVAKSLTGPIPGGKPHFYQKHMTLHLLPQLDRGWLAALDNCFLIREPEAVVASYAAVRSKPSLDDIGFVQQGFEVDATRAEVGKPGTVDIGVAGQQANPPGLQQLREPPARPSEPDDADREARISVFARTDIPPFE